MFGIADDLRNKGAIGPASPGHPQPPRGLALAHDAGGADLVARADRLHAAMGRAFRELLATLLEVDRSGAWEDAGARDLPHWVQIRYGLSSWKAQRWVQAAYALETLPSTVRALEQGEMGGDKVVELTRFATPGTERTLLAWASSVSAGAIRRRAELEARRPPEASAIVDSERRVRWWLTDEGRRMELMAELPAADGALVADAIERAAADLPEMPEERRADTAEARRADALVALCTRSAPIPTRSERGGVSPAARPRIMVHAPLAALASERRDPPNAEVRTEGIAGITGGVIEAPTLHRLACDAELQVVLEDSNGQPLRLGRSTREPPPALARAVRIRDRECRFPGCGARRHTAVHHLVWWSKGGRTDVENLVLLCSFHHRLVHEHGWAVRRSREGHVRWIRPDGSRYRSGPSRPI